MATRDTELAGVTDPGRLDGHADARCGQPDERAVPGSRPLRHLPRGASRTSGLGHGVHVCLGMHLARLEMRVALKLLLDRLPNLRLDPEGDDPHIRGQVFRSPTSLPVLFETSAGLGVLLQRPAFRYLVRVTKARSRPDRSAGLSPLRAGPRRVHRTTARRLSIDYAVGLACAHLCALGVAAAIVVPLNGQTVGGAQAYFVTKNVIIVLIIVVLGSIAVAVGGVWNLAPVLRWFVRGQQPDPGQRRTAMSLIRRQSIMLAATWIVSGAIFLLLNLDGGVALAIATLLAVVFGGTAAASISLLLTQRTIRPVMLAAAQGEGGLVVPRVLTRLMIMWFLGSALPCATIGAIVFIRSNGWIIQKTAPIEIPVLVITLAAVLLGLPAMLLTSRSISDPICEVVDAMAEVERGRIDTFVGVYERSEIGRLQTGFNRMVTGIAERNRLGDLFGRHVGADGARRAFEEGTSLSGDVREAAILFIDLVGSTTLATTHAPERSRRGTQ